MEISRVSGNTHLYKQQYAVYQQIHLIQISKYTDIEDSLIQIHHHVPIIKSIRNADLRKTVRLICDHIKEFYRLDPYLMKCYGYDQETE